MRARLKPPYMSPQLFACIINRLLEWSGGGCRGVFDHSHHSSHFISHPLTR